MRKSPMRVAPRPLMVLVLAAGVAGVFPLAIPATSQPATAPAQSSQTALDRYVAAPDSNFTWKVARELPAADGATAALIEMTSQQWLTDKDVERPLWTHWITVVRPATVTSDVGLLFIGGGSNERQPPARPAAWLVDAARETGTVTAELRLVPNQPVIFKDDPSRKPRSEDDFIAYTWDKYLRTGDEKWPARLPMTKSAVRAMDAITAFAATAAGGGKPVTRFVVSGASKRGWTTWTTAATDRRVIAIAPAVIDMLNVEPSFVHHWRAYGAWSDAVKDYVDHGIMDWMGTRQFRALMKIEEPYEYRDRLTIPKFMLNASGDQFFLPDSSQFYFDDLRGEKYLRYVPNASHSLDKTDALESLQAFYATVVKGTARPSFTWTFEGDGSIKVVTKDRPDEVVMWQAVNPAARNFRHDVIGSAYTPTPLAASGPNTYVARVPKPAAGWTAFFVELKFPTGGKYPLKVTSGVRVLPDTLPYPPPKPSPPTERGAASGNGSQGGSSQEAVKSTGTLKFRAEQIAADFGIGYAVTTGDVNGDGRTDVVAINATDLVWFEAPSWQKHVIISGLTPRDNVCLAVHDIDRDGRLDVALGASWQPTNTTSGGTLHWVKQGAPGAAWELHAIAEEPTLHRIRWADVDGDKTQELVVTPLHGRGTKGPDWQGPGARVLVFRPPANPAREPWSSEVADDTLHILHNFLPANLDADAADELLTASREGVNILERRLGKGEAGWSRTLIGEGSPGEIKLGRVAGRRMIATIEPWHGKSVVIYAEQPGVWARTVIESEITGGHALGWADFDGDGSDELAVGWRDQKPGVAVYTVDRDGALKSKVMVDEGGMATEDLVVADLNGDKQPDIIASGRATRNVKIYWNETRSTSR